jgi:hypothetical protein
MNMRHCAALLTLVFFSLASAEQPPVVTYPVTYPVGYNGHCLTQHEADGLVGFIVTIPGINHRVLMISVHLPGDIEVHTGPRLGDPRGDTLRVQKRDGRWALIQRSKGSGF